MQIWILFFVGAVVLFVLGTILNRKSSKNPTATVRSRLNNRDPDILGMAAVIKKQGADARTALWTAENAELAAFTEARKNELTGMAIDEQVSSAPIILANQSAEQIAASKTAALAAQMAYQMQREAEQRL